MFNVNSGLISRLGIPSQALSGQTALITGAARGIGEGAAATLAALGAQVVIVDILDLGQSVADAIVDNGGQATFIQCDLSDVDDLMSMLPRPVAAFGQVDLLINDALHSSIAPIVDLSLEEWEKTFATNARAPFLTIKHLLPAMLEREHGVIVNVIAYEGTPLAAAYGATKMALRSMAVGTAIGRLATMQECPCFRFSPVSSTRHLCVMCSYLRLQRRWASRKTRSCRSSPTTRATTGSCQSIIARPRWPTRSSRS